MTATPRPGPVDLRGQLRERHWQNIDGVPYTDYVCRACMAIVVDLQAGCRHCRVKADKQAERLAGLASFLAERRDE